MATLLHLPLSSPIIVNMSPDEVEMTYAFHMEREDAWWARFERTLGTTWRYDDVSRMLPAGKEDTAPLLGPGQKLFMPLTLALNPAIYKEVKDRFGADSGSTTLGDGEVIHGESLFSLPKEEFIKRMGGVMARTTGVDPAQTQAQRPKERIHKENSPDTPIRKNPALPKRRR